MEEDKSVNGFVILTGIVEEEGDQFVSYCRELGTSSCGDTIDEAFSNLEDAITVHLDALQETGERERVFRERNISLQRDPRPEEFVVFASPGKTFRIFEEPVSTGSSAA